MAIERINENGFEERQIVKAKIVSPGEIETLEDGDNGSLCESEPTSDGFSIGIFGKVHGAGASTVTQELELLLKFKRRSAGEERRELLHRVGKLPDKRDSVMLAELNQEIAQKHPQTDIRTEMNSVGRAQKGVRIIESRAGAIFAKAGKIPRITKSNDTVSATIEPLENPKPLFLIVLTCDKTVAAERVLQREGKPITPENIQEQIANSDKRMSASLKDWNNLYGEDFAALIKKPKTDLPVINTTNLSEDEVVAKILQGLITHPKFSPLLSDITRARIDTFLQEHPLE